MNKLIVFISIAVIVCIFGYSFIAFCALDILWVTKLHGLAGFVGRGAFAAFALAVAGDIYNQNF